MIQNKYVLALLAILLLLKFAYVPWTEWADEKEQSVSRLASFNQKQQQAINNTESLEASLNEQKAELATFRNLLPTLGKNEKANTLWFSLVESLKNKDIKIYNQKVEFEETVANGIGYVTGSLIISGPAHHVIQAVLKLENKAPSAFLDKLNLNRSGKGSNDKMVAQLYLGYWFSLEGETVQ